MLARKHEENLNLCLLPSLAWFHPPGLQSHEDIQLGHTHFVPVFSSCTMSPTILSDIYHLVRQFHDQKQEKKRQETVRRTSRQDNVFSSSNFMVPLVVFASVFSLQTATLYLGNLIWEFCCGPFCDLYQFC